MDLCVYICLYRIVVPSVKHNTSIYSQIIYLYTNMDIYDAQHNLPYTAYSHKSVMFASSSSNKQSKQCIAFQRRLIWMYISLYFANPQAFLGECITSIIIIDKRNNMMSIDVAHTNLVIHRCRSTYH